RVAYLVCDARSKAPDCGEALTHADFVFEPAHFREIGERVNQSDHVSVTCRQGRYRHTENLHALGCRCAHLTLDRVRLRLRQRIKKKIVHQPSNQIFLPALEIILPRRIDKSYESLEISSNQAAAHRSNDVVLQRLKVLEFATLLLQFNVSLT